MSDIKFAVIFFLSRDEYLGDGATDGRDILQDGTCPGSVFTPFGGGIPRAPKIRTFGPLKSEYLENGKSQRYIIISYGLTSVRRQLSKMYSMGR